MRTVPLETASPELAMLAAKTQAGEEIILTDHGRPVARMLPINGERPPATDSAPTYLILCSKRTRATRLLGDRGDSG